MPADQLQPSDIALTEDEEGFVPYLYHDAVGVATIGFGTTAGAGVVDPLPNSCSREEASEWLLMYMNRSVVPAILASGFQPNQNQLGGLADLGYNTGSGVFEAGAAMGDALRSKDAARVSAAFMEYVYAGGEVLSDLVHRREADRALFDRPVADAPSYHYEWYPRSWQKAVERYDDLRALQHVGKLTRRERAWLAWRTRQCGIYAKSVARKARRRRLSDGKPSWTVERRGWLYQELLRRSRGGRVLPR
jgi:lysozyme